MLPAVIGHFTLWECILLTSLFFLNVCPIDFVDAAPCEVTYRENYRDTHCRKMEERELKVLNHTHHVFKYKCDGADDVYENCDGSDGIIAHFELNDCALTADTFSFCKGSKIFRYRKTPGNYTNVVLRNGTFPNHHKVGYIVLSGNGIQSVESGAFCCLDELRRLDMSHNYLEGLPDDAFRCLPRLWDLDLSNNRISVMPKCLRDLPSLIRLDLSDNSITVFPETALHERARLTFLYLNRNGIQTFCPAEIRQLEDLVRLYLRENNITSLTKKCFIRQKYLVTLDIGMNVGLVLENDVFVEMDSLTELYIDGCGLSIGIEGSTMFSDTTGLKIIHLQRNHLREIYSELFQNLISMEHLDLSFNAISVLHYGCFANNYRLEYLDLSNNILSEILNGDFPRMHGLIFLSISNNIITNVAENAFRELRNLKTLNISNNKISAIMPQSSDPMHPFRPIFRNLSHLEILDMSNVTSMDFVLDFSEENKNIRQLGVSFNVGLRLESYSLIHVINLRTFISKGTNIPYLHFSHTNEDFEEINMSLSKIQYIDVKLFTAKNLRKLDLSWNNISYINSFVLQSSKIEYVNLSHNALHSLNIGYPFKRSLNVLDISSNRFSRIIWKEFTFVDNLWASNNTLNELILSEFVETNFESVHLEDCKIRKVQLHSKLETENGINFRKTRFFLARNTLVCDCHAFQLYEYVKKPRASNRFLFEGLACRHPVELEGKEMKYLLPGDFLCEVNTSCPETCRCLKRAHDYTVTVNCSHRDLGSLPEYIPANTTILDVSYNRITSLQSLNSSIWENLTEIRAEGNLISSLEFEIPKNMKIVFLHGNNLTKLPENHTADTWKALQMTLSENPWPCSCESVELKEFLSKHGGQIRDASEVRCAPSSNSTTLLEMKEQDLCPRSIPSENLLPGDFCEVNRSCPETCRCLKRSHDDSVTVNCSHRDLGSVPEDVPANTTILDVSYNRITSLESLNSSIWENLTEIRAEGNFISSLDFEVPRNLRTFFLHGNKLTKLPENLMSDTWKALQMTLSENPWPCSCESVELKEFLSKHGRQILDAFEVRCAPSSNSTSNLTILEMKEHDLCPKNDIVYLEESSKNPLISV